MKAPRRKALFEAIFRRDGGRCAYCGVPVRRLRKGLSRAGDLATLDHVRPRSQGGRLEEGNLVLACQACNNARGTLDAEAFRAAVRGGPRTQETSGHLSIGAPAAAFPAHGLRIADEPGATGAETGDNRRPAKRCAAVRRGPDSLKLS